MLENLRFALRTRGLSQRDFSIALRLPPQTISNWICGYGAGFPPHLKARAATLLGFNEFWLFQVAGVPVAAGFQPREFEVWRPAQETRG